MTRKLAGGKDKAGRTGAKAAQRANKSGVRASQSREIYQQKIIPPPFEFRSQITDNWYTRLFLALLVTNSVVDAAEFVQNIESRRPTENKANKKSSAIASEMGKGKTKDLRQSEEKTAEFKKMVAERIPEDTTNRGEIIAAAGMIPEEDRWVAKACFELDKKLTISSAKSPIRESQEVNGLYKSGEPVLRMKEKDDGLETEAAFFGPEQYPGHISLATVARDFIPESIRLRGLAETLRHELLHCADLQSQKPFAVGVTNPKNLRTKAESIISEIFNTQNAWKDKDEFYKQKIRNFNKGISSRLEEIGDAEEDNFDFDSKIGQYVFKVGLEYIKHHDQAKLGSVDKQTQINGFDDFNEFVTKKGKALLQKYEKKQKFTETEFQQVCGAGASFVCEIPFTINDIGDSPAELVAHLSMFPSSLRAALDPAMDKVVTSMLNDIKGRVASFDKITTLELIQVTIDKTGQQTITKETIDNNPPSKSPKSLKLTKGLKPKTKGGDEL